MTRGSSALPHFALFTPYGEVSLATIATLVVLRGVIAGGRKEGLKAGLGRLSSRRESLRHFLPTKPSATLASPYTYLSLQKRG